MNRMWNVLSTKVMAAEPAGAGGGPQPAGGAAPANTGTGTGAAQAVPEPVPANPSAARAADFDRYKWDDNLRGVANQYLDHFSALDAAQQAVIIEQGLAAQAAALNPPPDRKTPKGKPVKQAPTEPAPETAEPAEGAADAIGALQAQIAAQQAKLDELLGAKRREEGDRQVASQKEAWRSEVEATLKEVPALEKLMGTPARRRALTAQALGYVAEYQAEHGGSRAKALKAFLADMSEIAAESAGIGVKEWLERKVADQGAASSDGAGRPPAEVNFKPDPNNLESGRTLQRALKAADGA